MKQKLSILYVFVLALVIMVIIPGCVRKRPPSIPIETYEFHCRNLSDNELIAEFYRVDMELQEALDDLLRYERALDRTMQQEDLSDFGYGNWVQRQTMRNMYRAGQSFAKGSIIRRYLRRVKELRMQKAIVLTIIHQRGLTLPVSVK